MPQDASDGYERLTDIAEAAKNEGSELKHVIRDVYRNYSELGSDIHDYYEKNLKKFPETVEQTANDLYSFSLFANSIFLLVIASFSRFVGSYITAPVFGIIFLNVGAIILSVVVVPIIATYVYQNLKVRSLAEKRIACAGFIFLQSVLIGFINQNDWLESVPFSVLTQIISSFSYPLILAHTDNRQKILGIVAGSSMIFHLAHGFFFSGMDGAFLTIAILYTILAICLIQYSIAFRCQTDFDMMLLTMQYVFLVSVVRMFAVMSFGKDK
ncbi:hypothetical protein B9Z55_006484 [Caenorhabditis nigoni]|uniref:Uncharacterized protein n=1 Tax=Caenorhabditis nigoni TaxID=1611254 RepID=A0A2G5V643_9PELO|nr:hypothetical protein B9Z55_006484 [Caenorhabditis nigoni]